MTVQNQTTSAPPLAVVPGTASTARLDELRQKLEPFGQEHVVRYWDELTEDQRDELYEQVIELDLKCIETLFQNYGEPSALPTDADHFAEPNGFALNESRPAFHSRTGDGRRHVFIAGRDSRRRHRRGWTRDSSWV